VKDRSRHGPRRRVTTLSPVCRRLAAPRTAETPRSSAGDGPGSGLRTPGRARQVARGLRRASSIASPDPRGRVRLSPEATLALVEGLRSILTVTYVPLSGLVAVLDTTTSVWALHLDSDSPPEDHCWAMIDVLEVLRLGPDAARHGKRALPPRSVQR
jgi:hypothetical protein